MGTTFSSLTDNNDYKLMDKKSENYILRNVEINRQIENLKKINESQKRSISNINEKIKNIEINNNNILNQLKLENKHLKLQINKNKDIKKKTKSNYRKYTIFNSIN